LATLSVLPLYKFHAGDRHLKYLGVLQSYVIFATFLSVFWTAPRFGSTPECNIHRRLVIFGAFSAVHSGRILALVATTLAIVLYTAGLLSFYWRDLKQLTHRNGDPSTHVAHDPVSDLPSGGADPDFSGLPDAPAGEPTRPSRSRARPESLDFDMPDEDVLGLNIDGMVIIHLILIPIVAIPAIVNTELLRRHNHPQVNAGEWGLSQVCRVVVLITSTAH
jgi:hypothetical protein